MHNIDSVNVPLPLNADVDDGDGNGETTDKGKAPVSATSLISLLRLTKVSGGPRNNTEYI